MSRLTHNETQRRLTLSLLNLLEKQPLYEVQVCELCARAHVHRSTFYKHYTGMEGFVASVETAFVSQMNAALADSNVFLLSSSEDAREMFLRCTEFMRQHVYFAQVMLGPMDLPR